MQIAYRSKNIELTPGLKSHVEKKIGKIGKYFDEPLSVSVNLYLEHNKHIVEVTIPVNGMILRGEESSPDMYASVDMVIEKLERQIEKYKTRINRRGKGAPPKGFDGPDSAPDDAQVVKSKRFTVKPIASEEAILQMNMVGHDFYVFVNSETDQVNVVYRRKDGNYGLLEPSR